MSKILVALIAWPIGGALFAGGLLAVLHYAGAPAVRPLGRAGGEGFAEGMAKFNEAKRMVQDAAANLGQS